MARFYGRVGYGTSVETPSGSGAYVDQITELIYYGDVIRDTKNTVKNPEKLNDDISVSNSISVIADEYAIENFTDIKYVEWNGVLWTVTNVEVRRPRLILSLGEVYNGPTE